MNSGHPIPRILVIEDNTAIANLTKRALEIENFSVTTVDNGKDGLDAILRDKADLVLLDYILPDMSGDQLISEISTLIDTLPVIVITGFGDEKLVARLFKMGIADYVLKGSDPKFIFNLPRIAHNALQRFNLKSAKKNLEKDLKESELRFRKTFDAIPVPSYLWELQKNGSIILAGLNRAALFLAGTDAKQDDLMGLDVTDFFDGDTTISTNISHCMIRRESLREERKLDFKRMGGERWYILDFVKYTANGVLLIANDISKRREAEKALRETLELLEQRVTERTKELSHELNEKHKIEEALRESEERFRAIVSTAKDAIILTDDMGKIRFWNNAAEELYGYSTTEVIGKELSKLILTEKMQVSNTNLFRKSLDSDLDDGQTLEIESVNKNGKTLIIEISVSHVAIANLWHCVVIIRDTTTRKMLEVQLRQAQKLESIGTLAAGIAHEINTPTQFVGDNLMFLKDAFHEIEPLLQKVSSLHQEESNTPLNELSELANKADLEYFKDEVPKAINQSLDGVKRVSSIVRAMREFAHPGKEEKTAFDINKAIESTVTVARNEWKYIADVEMHWGEGLSMVPCIPSEFNQVILNMLVNSSHAIASNRKESDSKGKINITTSVENNFAKIEIQDTGGGIPEHIVGRIFDPFFTTKPLGKGTGQGLAIAHNVIVDKHRGTINCETKVGLGTKFIIRIPLK